MMTLKKFCDLIDRDAEIVLKDVEGCRIYFGTGAKNTSDKYDDCEVLDFEMNDRGRLTFRLRYREKKPTAPGWQEGTVAIKGGCYRFWVKAYEEPSQYGIDGGRISKLMIKRGGKIVANYDRGWDLEPVDFSTEAALAIIRYEYDK